MNTKDGNFRLVKISLSMFAGALISGGVFAQTLPGVSVTASRPTEKIVGRSHTTDAPIVVTSITSVVNYSDLDIATHIGAVALENRVKNAAQAACTELYKNNQFVESDVRSCTNVAADKAMVSARAAIDAAEKEKNAHAK